ncbi:MAG: hypothetical protein VKI82_04560 [Leptolyngbya sp.]|nr:hypothetical protein [Leptolyngbya sp.]
MVHPSVGSTPHPSHSHPGMDTVPNPSLHRAIGGLMVNLDDELSRYRHSRTGQGPKPQPQRPFILRPKERPSLSLPPRPPQAKPARAQGDPPRTDPPTAIAQGAATARMGLPPFPSATGQALAPYVAMPDAYLESTAALLGSSDPGVALPSDTGIPDPAASHPEIPDSVPYYPTRYYPEPTPSLEQDSYPPSLAQRLSTPLGVGALLLLLVSSAGFGYLITSPTALAPLRNQPWMAFFPAASAPDAETGDARTPALGEVPTGLQGLGPDLSGQSPEALSLDQVSRLPVEPARSGAMAPSVVTAPTEEASTAPNPATDRPLPTASSTTAEETSRPQAPEPTQPPIALRTETVVPSAPNRSTPTTVSPSAVNPGSSRPVPQPNPPQTPPSPPTPTARPPQPLGTVTTTPTPAPTVAPPSPLTPSAPTPRTNYYVVTDYTGQQSLDSARSIVGDAYVRDFQGGSKIQMGAFAQESSARDLMQQLQQRGIPAQVYNTP